jgi:hypothetical protein
MSDLLLAIIAGLVVEDTLLRAVPWIAGLLLALIGLITLSNWLAPRV